MITKEQARGVLKAVNPVIYEGDELTRQLAETVIALHERVERLEGALRPFAQEHSWGPKDRFEIVLASQYGSIAGADLDAARAILKETTHD